MIKKNKLEKALLKNLEKLNYILTKNNILEFVELIGNKKQILIRNFLTRYKQRNRNRNRIYNFNSNFINNTPKNSNAKYSGNRWLYIRYCGNRRK